MALNNEPPGHNRLERLGLPGFGKNPGSPLRPRTENQNRNLDKGGIPLDEQVFAHWGDDGLREPKSAERADSPRQKPGMPVRNIHVMVGAVVVAVASLIGNYVQMGKLKEADELEGNLTNLVEDLSDRNDELRRMVKIQTYERMDAEEVSRRLRVELKTSEEQRQRLLDAYRALVLERAAAPQYRERVPAHADNRGGRSDTKGAAVDHEIGEE